MNENEILRQCYAYALGYYDGLSYGNEVTKDTVDALYRHYYKVGYERGVSDYCEETDLEEFDED